MTAFPSFRTAKAASLWVLFIVTGVQLSAQTAYYWDANGASGGTGGSGTWDNASSRWRSGSTTGTLGTWPTDNPSTAIANFQGSAGTATIASNTTIHANGLSFTGSSSSYEIASGNSNSELVLTGATSSIAVASATVGALNSKTTLSSGTTTFSGTGTVSVGRTSAGTSVTSTMAIANGGTVTMFSSGSRGNLTTGQIVNQGTGVLTSGTVTSSIDFSGGQVNAELASLRVGQRLLGNDSTANTTASTGNITATVNFGNHADSTINVVGSIPVIIGGINIYNDSYTGAVSGTLNIQSGTNTFTSSNTGASGVILVGQFASTNNTFTNSTNVASATATFNVSGGTTTLAPMSGSAADFKTLLIAGRDSHLGANSTMTGAVNLTGGTLNIAAGDVAGGGGTSTLTLNGGTLNLNGGKIGQSTGLITTLNFESGTLSNVSAINNGAGLTKTTSGILKLTGTNAYTGGTIISTGTLLVNGSITDGTGNVSVDANATLGGTGTIAGSVISAGATSTFAAGDNSAGTLTLNGGLNAAAGATFDYQLGTTSDLLALGSDVFTGSTEVGGLTFNFTDAGGLATGVVYTLATFGSSSGLDYTDLTTGSIVSGFLLDTAFGTGGYRINSNSLQVQFMAATIPEPSAFAFLAGAGAAGLVMLRESRRRTR